MDRAEILKKYLDQEKEGKEANLQNMSISYGGKAHLMECFWLCLLELFMAWTVYPWEPTGLLCIPTSLYVSYS